MQETDQWQEHFARRLETIEASRREDRTDIEVIMNWRITHMSEDHPKILEWQGRMWGKWLAVTGIVGGAALVLGFALGRLLPPLEMLFGK